MSWRPRPKSWAWATEVNRFTVVYDACVLYPAVVDGYQPLIPALELPDPDDRHVQAAAIKCGADLILTFKLDDLPKHALAS